MKFYLLFNQVKSDLTILFNMLLKYISLQKIYYILNLSK